MQRLCSEERYLSFYHLYTFVAVLFGSVSCTTHVGLLTSSKSSFGALPYCDPTIPFCTAQGKIVRCSSPSFLIRLCRCADNLIETPFGENLRYPPFPYVTILSRMQWPDSETGNLCSGDLLTGTTSQNHTSSIHPYFTRRVICS